MTSSVGRLIALSLLLLVVTSSGCEDDPFSPEVGREKIEFTVVGEDFSAGEMIVAVLVNHSDQTAGYNLCLADLEHQASGGWQRIPRHDGACPLIILHLAPGESTMLTQPVREEFPTGTYRFRTEVVWPLDRDQRFIVTTNSFGIEE